MPSGRPPLAGVPAPSRAPPLNSTMASAPPAWKLWADCCPPSANLPAWPWHWMPCQGGFRRHTQNEAAASEKCKAEEGLSALRRAGSLGSPGREGTSWAPHSGNPGICTLRLHFPVRAAPSGTQAAPAGGTQLRRAEAWLRCSLCGSPVGCQGRQGGCS